MHPFGQKKKGMWDGGSIIGVNLHQVGSGRRDRTGDPQKTRKVCGGQETGKGGKKRQKKVGKVQKRGAHLDLGRGGKGGRDLRSQLKDFWAEREEGGAGKGTGRGGGVGLNSAGSSHGGKKDDRRWGGKGRRKSGDEDVPQKKGGS